MEKKKDVLLLLKSKKMTRDTLKDYLLANGYAPSCTMVTIRDT